MVDCPSSLISMMTETFNNRLHLWLADYPDSLVSTVLFDRELTPQKPHRVADAPLPGMVEASAISRDACGMAERSSPNKCQIIRKMRAK